MEAHGDRIERLCRAYEEAHGRFVARLAGVPAARAEAIPPDGGWSAAQIGWHVAAVDAAFADLVSGARPSQPLTEAFRERAWSEVAAAIPQKLEASRAVLPPAAVQQDTALAALAASAGQTADGAAEPDSRSWFTVRRHAPSGRHGHVVSGRRVGDGPYDSTQRTGEEGSRRLTRPRAGVGAEPHPITTRAACPSVAASGRGPCARCRGAARRSRSSRAPVRAPVSPSPAR